MLQTTFPHPSRRKARAVDLPPSTPTPDLTVEKLLWLVEERVMSRLDTIIHEIKSLDTRSPGAGSTSHRAIRLPEVLRLLAISKSTLYERLNPKSVFHDRDLPRPFKLGGSERSPSVWWAWEVAAYLEHKSASRATH